MYFRGKGTLHRQNYRYRERIVSYVHTKPLLRAYKMVIECLAVIVNIFVWLAIIDSLMYILKLLKEWLIILPLSKIIMFLYCQ